MQTLVFFIGKQEQGLKTAIESSLSSIMRGLLGEMLSGISRSDRVLILLEKEASCLPSLVQIRMIFAMY